MGNRVLSLDEVLALPDGARVWVESAISYSVQHAVCRGYCDAREFNGDDEVHEFVLVNDFHKYWPIELDEVDVYFGRDYRVWSLPQPPTPDELMDNPWPEGV